MAVCYLVKEDAPCGVEDHVFEQLANGEADGHIKSQNGHGFKGVAEKIAEDQIRDESEPNLSLSLVSEFPIENPILHF